MEETYIQSRQNDQIKNLVKLRERKHRDRQECFLVEGLRELSHALNSNYNLETIYYCPEYFPTDQHTQLIHEIRGKENPLLVRVSEEAFNKATYREGPDGIIAVARQQAHSIHELDLSPSPLLLILEGIEKPGNLGAILRSADGAGADAVILVDCLLDLYNPNAIRASQGMLFSVPIVCTEQAYLAEWLSDNKIQSLATTPDTSQLHWDVDYKAPTAFLFGSESSGLSEFWLNQATQNIRIPMAGKADSLNVSAAAAICLYEAGRQRFKRS
ncbi:MAG: TrmH family RNA methyltransferase [Zhongshania aliphaticivorans]|jgi:TrmH family RNA methyltransferase